MPFETSPEAYRNLPTGGPEVPPVDPTPAEDGRPKLSGLYVRIACTAPDGAPFVRRMPARDVYRDGAATVLALSTDVPFTLAAPVPAYPFAEVVDKDGTPVTDYADDLGPRPVPMSASPVRTEPPLRVWTKADRDLAAVVAEMVPETVTTHGRVGGVWTATETPVLVHPTLRLCPVVGCGILFAEAPGLELCPAGHHAGPAARLTEKTLDQLVGGWRKCPGCGHAFVTPTAVSSRFAGYPDPPGVDGRLTTQARVCPKCAAAVY